VKIADEDPRLGVVPRGKCEELVAEEPTMTSGLFIPLNVWGIAGSILDMRLGLIVRHTCRLKDVTNLTFGESLDARNEKLGFSSW
jgi:hypothetical protein